MKLPRFTITATTGLVFLVAIDLVTFRLLCVRPEWGLMMFDAPIVKSIFVCLPMTNLLAIGGPLGLRCRGGSRGFWIGFSTMSAIGIVVVFVEIDRINQGLVSTGLVGGPGRANEWGRLLDCLTLAIVIFPAHLVLAIGGGWVGRTIGKRLARDSDENRPERRFRLASSIMFVILAGLPAAISEGFRKYMDPDLPRLAVGSAAEFIIPAEQPVTITFIDGTDWSPSRNGKATIVADNEVYDEASIDVPGVGYAFTDGRLVQVKLIDGPYDGEVVKIKRCFLHPTR